MPSASVRTPPLSILPKTGARKATGVNAKRIGPTLTPDRSRVLLRPFCPSSEEIASNIVDRVMDLPELEVDRLLSVVFGEFENRHEDLAKVFRHRFLQVSHHLGGRSVSKTARL